MAGKAGKRIYESKRWRKLRLIVFARDGWRCVRCGKAGRLECDHIKPVSDGGSWFDMDNLRTLCRGCHIDLSRRERQLAKTKKSTARKTLANMALEAAHG